MIVLFTLLALVLGLFCGLSGFNPTPVSFLSQHSDMILYILMFSVGISIGMHNGILKKIRQYHLKILIIPLGITVGSVIGGLICAVILGISPAEGAAVASGMGWYSPVSYTHLDVYKRQVYFCFSVFCTSTHGTAHKVLIPAG